ncbi:hypothetical protein BJ878DRAFT_476363 [Calycina marina]|uniref:Uncharacterized protein n=1 Tax=Calycina marina TaxID=1763456 RepID=A0A9P7ZBY9_9HELO|nr:hypothetical protein BJ878DRAFT_476363 [Calycina marina]
MTLLSPVELKYEMLLLCASVSEVTPQHLSSQQPAASFPCHLKHPVELNTTASDNSFIFSIISENRATNNRVLQLRPKIFFDGGYFISNSSSSPVLLGSLHSADLYNLARINLNQLYDLGPDGYLSMRQEITGTSQWTACFANASV